MSIASNIKKFREIIPSNVELVAVSKFHPSEMILEAYEAGQRNFGESRVQEFLEKEKILPNDIKWHFIGHLQTNKVKQLIGKTSLIESVDSQKLLELIDKESLKSGVITDILLQVHVAAEESKFGFYPYEIIDFFTNKRHESLISTRICGIMGMATNIDDINRVKEDFSTLHNLYKEIKENFLPSLPYFTKLSMGMSGDWPVAVEEGANIVRIGSAIFGERDYSKNKL